MREFSKSAEARRAMRQNVASRQQGFASKQDLAVLQSHGFKGWYAGQNLPHFDAPGVTQFLTIRLADSLPRSCIEAARSQTEDSQQLQWLDQKLDAGWGACWLRQPTVAQLCQDTLLRSHGPECQIVAWAIMPNHIHVLVRIGANLSMAKIVTTWKSVTAHRMNRILNRTGAVWQSEVWDRFLRSQGEVGRIVEYIEGNPVSARLTPTSDCRAWRWSSARWRRGDGSVDMDAARRGGPGQAAPRA